MTAWADLPAYEQQYVIDQMLLQMAASGRAVIGDKGYTVADAFAAAIEALEQARTKGEP